MSLSAILLLTVIGLVAGVINSVVGSGSLVCFPALLAIGFPPVVANVTNNFGLLPASIAGALSYLTFFRGEWKTVGLFAAISAAGGLAGALLLLRMPADAFRVVVPFLIMLALALVIFGPAVKAWVLRRSAQADAARSERSPLLLGAIGAAGIYGGYFGAAQGVILLSTFSLGLNGGLQRANAYKNAMTSAGNIAAAVVFLAIGHIAWGAAAILAITSFIGGFIGGRWGQKLPESVYRVLIVVVGLCALGYFLFF